MNNSKVDLQHTALYTGVYYCPNSARCKAVYQGVTVAVSDTNMIYCKAALDVYINQVTK